MSAMTTSRADDPTIDTATHMTARPKERWPFLFGAVTRGGPCLGLPQPEQKRAPWMTSVPQLVQNAILLYPSHLPDLWPLSGTGCGAICGDTGPLPARVT
jgi:hypothetical protein